MNNSLSPKGLPTATSLPVEPEVALEPVSLIAGEQDWEQLASVPFTYGVSAGGSLANDDNYEENDTLATAYDLSTYDRVLLSSIDGEGISYAGDEDWYKVTVDSGEQYFSTTVTFPVNSRYIDLELYNSEGTFISSAAYRSSASFEDFQREIKTILDPGDYYLKFNSLYSYSGQVSNTYDLSWSTQSVNSITDEFENNDTQATATDIRNQEGNYFTDLLLTDEDWYQIEATSGESWLRLNYEIGSSANPVTFNLYDEENNLITTLDSLQNSPYVQYLNIALPGDGNYYLQWIPSGNGNTYSFIWDTFGLPNLTVNDASVASTNPNPSETISVSWAVENTGEFDTWENWYDAVYLSDDTTFDYYEDTYLTAAYNNYYQGNPLGAGANYTKILDVTIPEYVEIGNKYLLFVTDPFNNFSPYGSQPESDNSDNVYNIPIFINGDAPNLVITEATAPTAGSPNSYIDVSWTVQNQGTSPTTAFAWYDSIYFSTDTVFDFEEDIYLSDSYVSEFSELFVPPLDPGETYTINASIYLYSNLGGSGYLLFTTDTYNDQIETNESDNTRYVPIEITSPNLFITNVTAPTTATTSQSISLSWTVENDSSVTTGSSYWYDRVVFSKNQIFGDSDDIYLTEQYIYSANGLPLEANETYSASSTLTLPSQAAGSGYLLFKTDNYNYQQETDETDNVYVRAIDIAAPNLTINATTPSAAILGQTIAVSWQVTNSGTVSAPADWYDSVFISNDQIWDNSDTYVMEVYTGSNTPLAAGSSYIINQNIILPQTAIGDRYLLFVTDRYNYQGETNETDNVVATAISLSAPDLVVSSATAPESGALGSTVSVSWTVNNQGIVAAPADWTDSIYLSSDATFDGSDTLVANESITTQTPLAAGNSYTITRNINLTGPISPGNRYLLFVADGNNNQGETNETNNVRAVSINLTAPPIVGTISAANNQVTGTLNTTDILNPTRSGSYSDDYTLVDFTVGEPVTLDLSAPFDAYLQLINADTQQLIAADDDSGPGLDSRLTFTPIEGINYTVRATSYGGGATGNYALAATSRFPDLVVSAATAPESGILGSTVSVSWTVNNQGIVAAPADWSDYIYWSSNDTFDGSDILITSISAAAQTPIAGGGSYSKTQNITLPNQTTIIGDGYLIFRADGNNAQAETDENNNNRAVAFHVDAPDLIVSNASAPESVTVGATISISWDVKNQGTVAANADWYDRIVISTDEIFGNADDTYLIEIWAGSNTPLADGATYTITSNVTLPSTATGNRYLLFKADNYNQQGETDENNNVYSRPINISAADLQVTGTNAPTVAVLGQTVELTWTVTNQGTGEAPRDWYDYVYLSSNQTLDGSDTLVTSEWISTQTPLAAGASYTISKNVNLPNFIPGNQYLLFVADRDNYQGEINENNNVAAVAISLTAPDLIVSNAVAPATGTVGKSIEVSWTVANQATTEAPADWYDYIYISDNQTLDSSDTFIAQELISTQTPLAAGGSYTITRNINLPNTAIGNRYLLFVADGSANQGETDNNNNIRSVLINLNAPDLVISNITAPVESLSGQPIDISWIITNQGQAEASGSWWDRVYLADANTGSLVRFVGDFNFTGNLAAGASLERTQSYIVPLDLTGNYRAVVITDIYGNIAEGTQNESNNATTDDRPISIQLSPVPNLQVSSVTAPPTAFSSQETVVQWTVANVGTGATNAPIWYDRVYLSLDRIFDNTDTYLGQTTNPSYLNAGDSYSNSLTVTLPRGIDGNYYFLVQTDAYNYVTEVGNEGDNFGSGGPTDVNLTPPSDLRVAAVNAPNGAFSGQPMNLSWTVANQGIGRTLETAWWDRVFMSADTTLDAGDRNLGDFYHSGALNAGQSYTDSATVNLPIGVAGNFFFFVQSDIYNNVYEHVFENNNANYDTTATNITLTPPPDLEVESISIPNNARSGGSLSINYRVTNFGATETPNSSWTDTFYLSSDNQLNTATDVNLGSVTHYGILNPDDSYDGTASFTLSNTLTGTYYVFGVTDSGNAVFELNNANNVIQSTNQVQIVSQPADLVVTEAIIPATGEAGKTIQVQWTVKNQGSGDTIVSSWSDRIVASTDAVLGDADDITLATFSRSGILAPNGTYSRTESVTLPFTLEGNYQLFFVTDSANNVYEGSNEGNNGSSAFPVNISRQTPDLQVTAINLPATAQSGTPINLNWTVANLGVGRTNSNYWYDEVYLSLDTTISSNDIRLGSVFRSSALDPSGSYTASGTFNIPVDLTGNYYALVRTDRDNSVIEGALENNNDKASNSATNISLSPVADLTIQSVDAPEQGIARQALSLTWTVVNNGANTGQTFYDAVYLSRDQVFDRNSDIYLGYRNHTGGLNGGDSYTATQSFNVPRGLAGRYYAFVVTDSGNAVYERSGESNNTNYDGFSTEIIIPPPSDLVVTNITVPNSSIPGQSINISYTVQNQGTDAAYGSWIDSVYLSTDTQWDIGDALVGQVAHSGDIAGGASYSGTLNGVIPGVNLGNYNVIVRSDIRNQVPEVNENNNTGVSSSQVTLDVETLTLGTPDTGNLGQGQYVYYRVDVEAGETLKLALDGQSDNSHNELYVRYGEMPTRGQFDFTVSEPFVSDPNVIIPTTQAGTYYIMAYGDSVPSNQTSYSIEAEILPFGISHLSTNQGGNSGQVTLQLQGAKFDGLTKVELIDGNIIIQPIWYDIIDPTRMTITFDLKGKPVGQYDLHAFAEQTFLDVSETTGEVIPETIRYDDVTLIDQFTIIEGGGAAASAQLLMPSAARFGNLFSFYVEITNEGTNDLPVPVYRVASPNGTPLGTTSDVQSNDSSQLQIMPVGELRSTVLAPGELALIPLFAKATQEPSSRITLENLTRPGELIDWDALEGIYRDQSSDTQWATTWGNFQGIVGDSWDSFHEAMRQTMDDLPRSQDTRFVAGELLIQDLLSRARLGQSDASGFIEEYNGEDEQAYYALIEQSVEDYNDSLESMSPSVSEIQVNSFSLSEASSLDCSELEKPIIEVGKDRYAELLCNCPASTAQLLADEAWTQFFVNTAIRAKFGSEVARIWNKYLNGTPSSPPSKETFDDNDDIGKAFKASKTTETVTRALLKEAKLQFLSKLNSGEIDCENIPTEKNITQILSADRIAFYQNSLNYNVIGEIPGNIAGGIGAISSRQDTRKIEGNILISVQKDDCDKVTSVELKTDLKITVEDGLDFCPGDLGSAQKLYGLISEQDVTIPMARLEGNGWAYDVPIDVIYIPEVQTLSISASELPEGCDPDQTPPLPPDPCNPTPPDECDENNTPPSPPPDCDDNDDDEETPTVRPRDPNDIIGPNGFGQENWISASNPLPYTIRFENQSSATAPAQLVTITHPLDSDLDWRTFRVGSFGWGGFIFNVPNNRSFYNQRLDLTADYDFYVDVLANIDVTSGVASWTLTTIDPETGETPENPLLGFLPPNNEDGVGDGFVNYTIRPSRTAETGDVIDAQATIIFDTEEPISTPPIFNTLDVTLPSSDVNDLPATTATPEFLVNWIGTDTGSALATYTIYVSDNGGAYTIWLGNTELTEATYIGTPGHTYAFFSVAVDNAGNTESAPTQADATIQVGGAVNQPPQISVNAGLTLNEEAISAIYDSLLAVTDTDNSAEQLTFTLSAIPTNGILQRSGITLGINDTFTQADIDTGLLSYAHGGGETTVDVFSFTVSDGAGGNIGSTNFAVTVNPVDDAPTILNPIADVSVAEDTEDSVINLSNVFTDIDDDDALIVKSVFANDNTDLVTATIADNQLTLDYQDNQSGTAQITIQGTSNGKTVEDTFTASVGAVDNLPTVLNPIADVSVAEDAENSVIDLSNVFTDIDDDDVSIVKSVFANDNTGLVTATIVDNQLILDYQDNQFGTATITIRGTSNGKFVDDTFVIIVNSVDDIPTILNPIADVSVAEDAENSVINNLSNVFTDIDNDDALIVKAVFANDNTGLVTATIVDNQLTLDYQENQFGTTTITIRGTSNGKSVDDTFVVSVTAVDDAPTILNLIADVNVAEDAENSVINLSNVFTDIDDNDALIVKSVFANDNTGLVTTTIVNNQLTLNYQDNQFGTATITIRGTSNGKFVDDIFVVTVEPVNDTPTLQQEIANQTAIENQLFSFAIPNTTFVDIDGDSLSYTLAEGTILPDGITFNAANRTFSGTPSDTASGIYSLTVIASDSQGESAADTFTLNVLNTVNGNDNNETVNGTSGDDYINAGAGNDTVNGSEGNDILDGGTGNDRLIGRTGNDTYIVDSSRDVASESTGEGHDTIQSSVSYTLTANIEDITLTGNAKINATGNDLDNVITGNSGNNLLKGLGGNDTLIGGAGNDTLIGGAGNDVLTGGEGSDSFLFGSGAIFTASDFGVDSISDFTKGSDKVALSKTSFAALASAVGNSLQSSEFATINDAANELALVGSSSAKIVYNLANGNLFYNQNGASDGLGSGGIFATLNGIPNLEVNDFLVQA